MDHKMLESAAREIYQGIYPDLWEEHDLDDACSMVGDMMYDRFGSAKDHGIEGYWSTFLKPVLEGYY